MSNEDIHASNDARIVQLEQVDFDAYFCSLYARRHTAEPLRFRSVSIDGWFPDSARCHANVEYFVLHRQRLNHNIRAVRGWLIITEDECGRCLFSAHSVVEVGRELFDITIADPLERKELRFLAHNGSDELFCAVADRFRYLLYPPITVDELAARGYEKEASEEPMPIRADSPLLEGG